MKLSIKQLRQLLFVLIGIVSLLALYIVQPARASVPTLAQSKKITAPDGTAGDLFGDSVSIDGDYLVVGAPGDVISTTYYGSVYLFGRNTGGTDNWGLIAKLLPSDPSPGMAFGYSVDISGTNIVVGAFGEHLYSPSSNDGSAYLFDANCVPVAGVCHETRKLLPSARVPQAQFGYDVGISGTNVVIGSFRTMINSIIYNNGAVYVFGTSCTPVSGVVCNESKLLIPPVPGAADNFGAPLSIGGSTVVVAAAGDDGNGTDSGAAYVFDVNCTPTNGTCSPLKKLLPSDGQAFDNFGQPAIDGSTIVVGAMTLETPNTRSGAAYLFDANCTPSGGACNQSKKLVAPGVVPGDYFGTPVGISGDVIIVGASGIMYLPGGNNNAGKAYIFDGACLPISGVCSQTQQLAASDGTTGNAFSETGGHQIEMSGDTLIISAAWDNNTNGSDAGAIYLFQPASPPAAPSGLTSTAVYDTQTNLSWTDNSDDETGFRIERSDNGGGSWSTVTTTSADVSSYNDTDVAASTAYSYRVIAVNSTLSLESAPSNTINITTSAPMFVVNTTDDTNDGACNPTHCSLREAINATNAHSGADTIEFNIPSSGVQTINVASALPTITGPVTIDGLTQPGFAGSPIIQLQGPIGSGVGFDITGGNSIVRGFIISDFATAIHLHINGGNTIAGNYIGTDPTGNLASTQATSHGILVDSSNNVIGGATATARNIVASKGMLIQLTGNSNVVAGNYVGVNASGTAAFLDQRYGVNITGDSNQIGGSDGQSSNLISGYCSTMTASSMTYSGIRVTALSPATAVGTIIQGNIIGFNPATSTKWCSLPYTATGIMLEEGSLNTTIGGFVTGTRNVVSGFDTVDYPTGFVRQAIWIDRARGTLIQGNFIGTDVTGTVAIPNFDGITVYDNRETDIDLRIQHNLISGNLGYGVDLTLHVDNTDYTLQIQHNLFGSDLTGALSIPNGTDTLLSRPQLGQGGGIRIDGYQAHVEIDNNLIAHNDNDAQDVGILINNTALIQSTNNCLVDNSLGLWHQTTDSINFANNWWGSSTGPTVASNPTGTGQPITGAGAANVTYAPFLAFQPACGGLPATPVAAPTGLNAVASSPTQINLSWTDNSLDETEFRIERSPNGSGWVEIGTVAADATTYSDTGLTCNTSYQYRVSAYRDNDGEYSGYSNIASATTSTCPPPPAPSGLSTTAVSSTQINLSWVDNATDETNYRIERSPNGTTGWTQIATVSANAIGYSNTGLVAGTTYHYRVRAYRSSDGQYSNYSNISSATPQGAPAVVTSVSPLNAAFLNTANPALSWSPATNAVSYEIQIDNASSFTLPLVQGATVTTTSHTASSLPQGLLYWRVRGVNTYGAPGAWSAVRYFTVDTAAPGAPALSVPADGVKVTVLKPTLVVSAVAGANRYHYQVSSDSGFGTLVANGMVASTAYTLPVNLPTFGQYWWRTSSLDAAGNESGWSVVRSFVFNPMNVPVNGAFITTTQRPVLSWAALPGMTGWTLQVDDAADFSSPLGIPPLGAVASYTPPSNLGYGTYYWHVKVTGTGLPANWSPTWSFTISPAALAAPVLSAPANASLTNSSTPDLSWGTVANAVSYEIQIDSASSFALPLTQSGTSSTTSYTASSLPQGLLYWRVRGVNSYGAPGAWSALRYFTVDTAAPGAPVLSAPADGVKVTVLKPTLVVSAVAGANRYHYQVSSDSGFGTLVANGMVASTAYTLPVNLPTFGQYWWRASSLDAAGNESGWSVVRSFVFNPMNVPVNGVFITTTQRPALSWAALPGMTGWTLEVDDAADFSSPLPILPLGAVASYTPPSNLGYGTYYWHVKVTGAGLPANWSPTWSFTVSPAALAAPLLSAPANASLTNSSTPDLSWGTVANAVSYEIQIDNASSFTLPLTQSGTSGTTGYTASSLPQGLLYWRVRGVNSYGAPGVWSALRYFTVPPAAPTLLSPADDANTIDTTPTLSINALIGAAHYNYQVATNSGFTAVVTDIILPATSYTPLAALAQDAYYWRVRGQDSAGHWGEWSVVRSFSIVSALEAPVLVSPPDEEVISTTTPLLDWDSVSLGDTYQVQLDDSVAFDSPVLDQTLSQTILTTDTLSSGSYYWRVRAYNNSNEAGSWSTVWSFVVPPAAPALSSPADGASVTDTTPTLTVGPVTGAAQYNFQIAVDPGFVSVVENVTVATMSHSPSTALVEGAYYWRVRALNSSGHGGSWSGARTFTIIPLPAAPALVSPADGEVVNTVTPLLDWDSVALGDTYQVQLDDNVDFGSLLMDQTISETSVASSLQRGTVYYWRVRAFNINDESGDWSVVWSIVVPPDAPTPTSPADGVDTTDSTPTLTVDPVTGAVQYNFQIATDSGFASIVENVTVASNSHTPSTPLPEATYYWRVRAQDAGLNWGDWSVTHSFTIVLDTPELLLPDDEDLVDTAKPQLVWDSVPRADTYRVQVDTETTFASPLMDETTSATSLVTDFLPGDTYYWRVKAASSSTSAESDWSMVRSLTPMLTDLIASPNNQGLITSTSLELFGPDMCIDYGDPYTPTTSPWYSELNGIYTYRIAIPPSYPYNLVRVELFDPQTGNVASISTVNGGFAYRSDIGTTVALNCSPSGNDRKDPCLSAVTGDTLNPYWFVRMDENRGGGGVGICYEPGSYTSSYNTTTRFRLYYYAQTGAGGVSPVDLAYYNGTKDDAVTQLRWISPGAPVGEQMPAFTPAEIGIPGLTSVAEPATTVQTCGNAPYDVAGACQGNGDFIINLSTGAIGGQPSGETVDIYTDPITGMRYIYMDVYGIDGASENIWAVWAGPAQSEAGYSGSGSRNGTMTAPTDVNARQVFLIRQNIAGSTVHDSAGISVYGVGHLPFNSLSYNRVRIPLAYLGPEFAGKSFSIELFDADGGTTPLIFYIDTIPQLDWSACFGAGPGECVVVGSSYESYLGYANMLSNTWGTHTFVLPNAPLFTGGRLMVLYDGMLTDTFGWKITVSPAP